MRRTEHSLWGRARQAQPLGDDSGYQAARVVARAHDAGDPPAVRLEVLERVVVSLRASDDRRELRRDDALRLVDNNRRGPGVDRRRLQRIRRDLESL